MSSEDIVDNDAPCGYHDKTQCDWRKQFDPEIFVQKKTIPGACIADAKSVECAISLREMSIRDIRARIEQDSEKIQIMEHEIAEMKAGRMKCA